MADEKTLELLEDAYSWILGASGGEECIMCGSTEEQCTDECLIPDIEKHLEAMEHISKKANWYPVCAKFGSGNLEIQAYVEWNPDENDWEVSQEFEDYTCSDCGDKGDHYDTETIDRNKDSEND